jgi:excisionase family DNA binding protein
MSCNARAANQHMKTLKEPTILPKLTYTVPEAAEMLSVSEKTVYRLLQRGHLKAVAAVRHKLIMVSSIKVFAGVSS